MGGNRIELLPIRQHLQVRRSILAYIESKARANASCIGLSLWVRADNKPARKLYEDLGFKYGANGSFDDDGLETFEMRKWFAS